MKKSFYNKKLAVSNLVGFENLRGLEGLGSLIFLLFITITTNAQDNNLQLHLEKATKNLANPIYAVIETPLPNGKIQYINILKTDIHQIQSLEKDYDLIKTKSIDIHKKIWYQQSLINDKDPLEREVKVVLNQDVEFLTKNIMVEAPFTKIEVVPAIYDTVTEKVLAGCFLSKIVTIPAEYKTVYDTILVKPETKRLLSCSPSYETVTEIVEVSPKTTKWVKRKRNENYSSSSSHYVWTLVEVPARYEKITKTVLRGGCCSTTKEITIPAEYQVIEKRVLIKPASTKIIKPEVEYQWVKKRIVKTPARTETIEFLAEYENIRYLEFKEDAQVETFRIPVEYKYVTKRLHPEPAPTRTVEIPAEFKTIEKQVLISPATDSQLAEYETVIEQVLVKPAHTRIEAVPVSRATITEKVPVTNDFDSLLTTQINTSDIIRIYRPKEIETIRIFPNPVNDFLQIEATQAIEEITIFNANGTIVKRKKWLDPLSQIKLDTRDLAKGSYIIQIQTARDVQTRKFIKQ